MVAIASPFRRQRPEPPDLNEPVIVRRPTFTPAPGFWVRSVVAVVVLAVGFFAFRSDVSSTVGDAIGRMVDSEKEPEVETASLQVNVLTVDDAPLQNGSRGPAVADLQRILNFFGFETGTPDGSYGNRTAEAVRQYQFAKRLNPDGIADDRTLAVLLDDVSRVVELPEESTSTTVPGSGFGGDPDSDFGLLPGDPGLTESDLEGELDGIENSTTTEAAG